MAEAGKRTSIFMCKAMLVFTVGTFLLRFIFSSVYFKQIGLCPSYSGIILGASRLAQGIGGITFGYLADRADLRNALLLFTYLAYAVTPFLITLPKPEDRCVGQPQVQNHEVKSKRHSIAAMKGEGNTIKDSSLDENSLPIFKRGLKDFIEDFRKKIYSTDKFSTLNEPNPSTKDANSRRNDSFLRLGARSLLFQGGMFKRSRGTSSVLMNDVPTQSHISVKISNLNRTYRAISRKIGNVSDDTGSHDSRMSSTRNSTSMNTDSSTVSRKTVAFAANSETLFYMLLAIVVTGDFLGGATINFFDTLVVSTVDDKKQYGKIRMWGNIGQAVTIPVTAIITYFKQVEICGVSHSDYKISLYITSVISGVGWLVAIFKVRMPSSKRRDQTEIDDENNEHVASSIMDLITPFGTWSMLVMVVFFGIFSSSLNGFLFWTMVDLDPSQANLSIAAANFFRNLAALFIYFFAPTILHAIGYRNTLSGSCLTFAVSYITASMMFTTWMGVIVEVLASIAYAMTQAACVSYFGEVAHSSIAVTAQGILRLLYTGIGASIGPALSGFLIDLTNPTLTFLIFSGMCIGVMAFSIIVQWIIKIRMGRHQKLAEDESKRSREN